MGSVWLTIPSARPATAELDGLFRKWHAQGYKIALWRDIGSGDPPAYASRLIYDTYRGYADAVNMLIRRVMATDPAAEWFVAAGDDTLPDPSKTAEEIAAECANHFDAISDSCWFGVMQPTGDRWHEGIGGFQNAPIDRVAGSAWYGREYCRRMYQGNGPLWHEFKHMFVDEHAQCVAEKLGVFWQRRDLVQKHLHWGRGETDKSVVELKQGTIPPHLEKWNTSQHWNESKAIFERLKAGGFVEAFDLLP